MSITDWIIILLFLGGLIAIGFAFSKKNKDLKDYFLAGKSMPTWLVVFAATGTSISAGTFVGSPELEFNTNLTFIMSCVGAVIGGVVVAALFLPKLYNSRTITIYGYIGDRFGRVTPERGDIPLADGAVVLVHAAALRCHLILGLGLIGNGICLFTGNGRDLLCLLSRHERDVLNLLAEVIEKCHNTFSFQTVSSGLLLTV